MDFHTEISVNLVEGFSESVVLFSLLDSMGGFVCFSLPFAHILNELMGVNFFHWIVLVSRNITEDNVVINSFVIWVETVKVPS